MIKNKNFAIFILTHGRADNVITYTTLREHGYTGKVIIVIDNEDDQRDKYLKNYGKDVVIFDKEKIAKTIDIGDNFEGRKAITYARNASYEIAKKIGIEYFIQLDDDYTGFEYRFDHENKYVPYCKVRNLDAVFSAILKFYKGTPVRSIALSQGGDFIGGRFGSAADKIYLKRKCMNSFFCSVDRPVRFSGRLNEDVCTYTRLATTGSLFFTTNIVLLVQKQTQSLSGGLTEEYREKGTYIKTFYALLYQPSSIKISTIGHGKNQRIHHKINWNSTTPKILRQRGMT